MVIVPHNTKIAYGLYVAIGALKVLREISPNVEKTVEPAIQACREAAEYVEKSQGKGRWIEYPECLEYDGAIDDTYIACSECGHVFNIMDNCTEEFDFCPHCGADMRGDP